MAEVEAEVHVWHDIFEGLAFPEIQTLASQSETTLIKTMAVTFAALRLPDWCGGWSDVDDRATLGFQKFMYCFSSRPWGFEFLDADMS